MTTTEDILKSLFESYTGQELTQKTTGVITVSKEATFPS